MAATSPTSSPPPPLKWAGGKRWLVPKLLPLWQPFQQCRLVEPFVGGMAIALGLRPQYALLNDINQHLINFYRCLQNGFKINLPMYNDHDLYYQYRQEFNQLILNNQRHKQQAAALFYYMNRTGFNGLCRFNKKGKYNVPMGRYKTINYKQDFSEYAPIFKNWEFTSGNFADMTIQSNDFIYADPPYDKTFTQYAGNVFDWAEQERLALWLVKQNVPVIASNAATVNIIELYGDLGFKLDFLKVRRKISCDGNREFVQEMLATINQLPGTVCN